MNKRPKKPGRWDRPLVSDDFFLPGQEEVIEILEEMNLQD
jgi:hypothetical protein